MINQQVYSEQGESINEAALTLRALAHSTRLEIVSRLEQHGRLNVKTLQQQLQIPQASLSRHLTKMIDRGVLSRQRQGKEMYYSISNPPLGRIIETLLQNRSAFTAIEEGNQ